MCDTLIFPLIFYSMKGKQFAKAIFFFLGMVWAENWFESCLSKIYSDICITHTVNRGWWFVHHHDITKKCDKRIVNDLKKYSEAHYEMLGGTSGQIKQKDWDKWVASVKYDPRPVKYSLAPIHYLLPDSHPKKKSLEAATLHLLKTSHEEQQKTIEALKKTRPPPASICKKIHPPRVQKEVRRILSMNTLYTKHL